MNKNGNKNGNTLISFVIPCYRSSEPLRQTVEKLLEETGRRSGYEAEVVLINDNPPDASWDLICDLAREHPEVRGYCLSRNFGQHAALMAGYRNAAGDIIVSLDDDGQTPPEEAFKLIGQLNDKTDVVYADYPENKFSNGFRQLGSKLNDQMATWLVGKPKGMYLSSYFAASRPVMDEVIRYRGPYPYVDGLVIRSARHAINYPVEHRDREEGESGYSFSKLLSLWLNGFTAFSVKPLRVCTVAGTVFAAAGFVFALIVLINKLIFGAAVNAGWSSIVCLQLIIGGILMFMIGMTGEYIGRIYLSLNASPQYIIRNETGSRCEGKPGSPAEPDGESHG